MFENAKITFKMGSPVAVSGRLFLDAIISAAKAKEILGDNYYNNNVPENELHEIDIPVKLSKKYNVYHASFGLGDNVDTICSWSKRFDNKNDDLIKFKGKGKKRVDIGAGFFKNYHMPIILKNYKEIVFYSVCNIEKVSYLLKKHINFIGKKPSQGYGEINNIIVEKIDNDYSIFKNNKLMRNIPVSKDNLDNNTEYMSIRPPYWRKDFIEKCYV